MIFADTLDPAINSIHATVETAAKSEIPSSKDVVQMLDSTMREINAASSFEQKAMALQNSKPFLEIQSAIKENKFNFTVEEEKQIDDLNSRFSSNKELTKSTLKTLLQKVQDFLRDRFPLTNSGQEHPVVVTEMAHFKEVVQNCMDAYPEMPLLAFIAVVHDSYKYSQTPNADGSASTTFELGLHEFMSAVYGPSLIVEAIQESVAKNALEVNTFTPETYSLIARLAQRVILTHGKGEFPEVVARNNNNTQNNPPITSDAGDEQITIRHFSIPKPSLYVDTSLSSVPENGQNLGENDPGSTQRTSEIIIAAMNANDALSGVTVQSFKKYNNLYSNEDIATKSTLTEYFQQCLLASFDGNIQIKAVTYLASQNKNVAKSVESHIDTKTAILANLESQAASTNSNQEKGTIHAAAIALQEAYTNLKQAVAEVKQNDSSLNQADLSKKIAETTTPHRQAFNTALYAYFDTFQKSL